MEAMTTHSASPAPRRSPFARRSEQSGPRARFSQLVPYLTENRPLLIFAIILSVIGSAASLAQPVLVGRVISLVSLHQPLGALMWALIGLVIVSGLAAGFQHYLLQRIGEGVVLSSRRKLVAKILHLPISEFDARRTGDLVSRIGSDTTLLRAVLTQGLIEAIGGMLTFVGALIAMFIIDPILLGLTVLVIAASVIVVGALAGRIRVASRKAQDKVGDLAASVERAVSGVRTIRAANATQREIAEVDVHALGAWKRGIQVAKSSALVVPLAGIAMQVSFIVVIGVGGLRVASGAITIASLVTFILFLFMMVLPLGQAFGAITAVNSALGALGRIQEILTLPSETDGDTVDQTAAPLDTTTRSWATENAVEFRSVTFTYPSRSMSEADTDASEDADTMTALRPVLTDVSFTVPFGKRIALVGPSGAGKSTTLALIERFYDVSAGSVFFAGVDVRRLDRTALRSQIGYVEQDAPVLAGTLRDNLLLSSPDATDEECLRVLRTVNLSDVLDRSPNGLGTLVGEMGVLLSGGERQRLAIARALLVAPPVLLLDESTSSMDGRNEQLMREAIDAVSANRTLLVIAHRLSTVVDSDEIVVLDRGRVVGVGTHSELVKSTPLYRELAKHQLLV